MSAAVKLGNAKGYKVNVADEPNVKAAMEKVIAERGRVDVLVNNEGLQFISPVEDLLPLHTEEFLMHINLLIVPLKLASATAIFLASNGAAAITGEEIGVTGGM
ncbi:SDR family NAD(P)-dependent oxidoreductase [Peribacillus butanolivorans]|uniref:SDR family NAD(P)-dependent oxidoreductase n=1 Tax=Peribacillus butanolivorans TaxID=421767 RepID=UPI0035D68C07